MIVGFARVRGQAVQSERRAVRLLPGTWHVLIDEDGVSVRIQQAKVRRARGRRVRLHDQTQALTLERLLDVPNIVEIRQRVAGAVPAGVERQRVLLKHPLEQPDGTGLILKDQPVTGGVAEDGAEAELLVKRATPGQVLDSKADGEVSQSHAHFPCGKSGWSSRGSMVPAKPGRACQILRTSERTRSATAITYVQRVNLAIDHIV